MIDRILLILKVRNLTASKFADDIGVQRSSISHIISGRNLPSLDLVQKILKKYPEINSEWLLSGVGPMSKSATNDFFIPEIKEIEKPAVVQPDLFDISENRTDVQDIDKEVHIPVEAIIEPVLELDKTPEIEVSGQISGSERVKKEEKTESYQKNHITEVSFDNKTDGQNNRQINSSDKKIEKIVIFYNNKTFREYYPE